jgi:arsenate reductase
MAEAFFNHYAAGKAQAFSAGTQPATQVDSTVIKAMKEVGVDLSARRPKALTPQMVDEADKVVTMGCGVEKVCPATWVPSEDWKLEDPEGKPIERVRKIRDEIKIRVQKLLEEIQEERKVFAHEIEVNPALDKKGTG